MNVESRLVCVGCAAESDPDQVLGFRCPETPRPGEPDDEVLHLLVHHPDLTELQLPLEGDAHPFIRYRQLLWPYRFGLRRGMQDEAYVELVRELDERIESVDGRRMEVTTYSREQDLGVWVKDETRNVAGSHKIRHLFAVALQLEVGKALDLDIGRPQLAVAGCANAARAAAVLARALGRPLEAFVPASTDPDDLAFLKEMGAQVVPCPSDPEDPGDPCLPPYNEALNRGALPFSVRGVENALVVDGGATLGWELAARHRALMDQPLEHVFVQAGNATLLCSTWRALRQAHTLGVLETLPRIHAVQASNSAPLVWTWRKLALETVRMEERKGVRAPAEDAPDAEIAAFLFERRDDPAVRYAIELAARQCSTYMRPWRGAEPSAATSIQHPLTTDWLPAVRAMMATGGWPVVVDEDELAAANTEVRDATRLTVGITGTAGYAAHRSQRRAGFLGAGEGSAILLTGDRG